MLRVFSTDAKLFVEGTNQRALAHAAGRVRAPPAVGQWTSKKEFRYEAASDSYRCPTGHSLRRLAAKGRYTVYGVSTAPIAR